MEMIYESKMNFRKIIFDYNDFRKAKELIFWSSYINKWNPIDKIPASIIGEFFKIWDEGITFAGRKIEIDETYQFYRLIKIN